MHLDNKNSVNMCCSCDKYENRAICFHTYWQSYIVQQTKKKILYFLYTNSIFFSQFTSVLKYANFFTWNLWLTEHYYMFSAFFSTHEPFFFTPSWIVRMGEVNVKKLCIWSKTFVLSPRESSWQNSYDVIWAVLFIIGSQY